MVESWLVVSRRSTRHCTGQRIFYGASFSVEELSDEIGETDFASRLFLRVRYKNCRPIKITESLH